MQEKNVLPLARIMGITDKNFPTIRAIKFDRKTNKIHKFKMDKEKDIEKSDIEHFMVAMISNKVKEYFKEEPVPKTQHPIVKKVVRENFEEIVMDESKHVVVAFRTDWCEHCKEIDTCFDDIKRELNSDVKDVIFGNFNYEKNDIDIEIKSFPTVYLYKKGQKETPIVYDAMRDYEVLLNWLEDELGRTLYVRKMPEELKK